jgi:hypothetical protein
MGHHKKAFPLSSGKQHYKTGVTDKNLIKTA